MRLPCSTHFNHRLLKTLIRVNVFARSFHTTTYIAIWYTWSAYLVHIHLYMQQNEDTIEVLHHKLESNLNFVLSCKEIIIPPTIPYPIKMKKWKDLAYETRKFKLWINFHTTHLPSLPLLIIIIQILTHQVHLSYRLPSVILILENGMLLTFRW